MTNRKKESGLIPAAGYIRMSTDDQTNSPDRQKGEIEKLAKRERCQIVAWYQDLGMTGTESIKRKDFQRMLTDAKSGKFKAVLMYEQSRLSREDPLDALEHLRKLRDAGVSLYTCQRGRIDTSNIAGLLLAVVESHGAHEESRKLSERSVSGRLVKLKAGHRSGSCILGYDRVYFDESGKEARRVVGTKKFRKPATWTVKLEPSSDPKQIETVRLIFKRASAGMSFGSIAKELNRSGLTTNFGRKFVSGDVSRIVQNPVFAGDLRYGNRRRGKFNSVLDHGPAIVVTNNHPPLVSREQFERANAHHRRRKPAKYRPKLPGQYLLSGLIYCANTQAMCYGSRIQGVRRYVASSTHYEKNPGTSSSSYRSDVIEQGVIAAVIRAFDKEKLEEVRRAISKRQTKEATAEAKLEGQLAEVRLRIDRAEDNITIAAAADVPGISRRLSEFREQEKELLDRLNALRGAELPTPDSVNMIAKLWKLLPTLGKEQAGNHRELLANALRKTIKRITLRTTLYDGPDSLPEVKVWTGMIEFQPGFCAHPVELTDDDIPTPYQWRKVLPVLKASREPMLLGAIQEAIFGKRNKTSSHNVATSIWLRSAAAAGRVEKLGHYKGWIFRR